MPQTTPERAARWPGMDGEAIKHLLAGGWKLCPDGVWRHPKGRQPTDRERDASDYLFEEWDYGGMEA